ncbi:hypothetical protein GQ57_16010 [Burkholderia sp. MSh2]|uniref:Phage antitermination protein Q n=2 Tax=Burkholderiaceae TaxID=119060 RepID=A0A6J5DC38_9BURK|nr:hypothetical protein GQ57_16010 [Burkholderia sp. MSh2]CAB3750881.1 hypothetical protein LMG30113_01318 [Burkholderia paludis]VWB09873.1 hypothetical protein BPA30113_00159 [Burkholderia paludis]
MTIDESNQIEELLGEWYAWQAGYAPSLGYGRVDPSCRGFSEDERTITADERSETAERKVVKRRAEQIEICIDELAFEHRAAIQSHFKGKQVNSLNRECHASVWRNPRIAFSQIHCVYQDAKRTLLPVFLRRGLMARDDIYV